LITQFLEGDGNAGSVTRRLADQDRSRRRYRLEPAGRVDQVSGNHPLALGTDCHRRFAGQYSGTQLEVQAPNGGTQQSHRLDQLERGADGPFRVILVSRRRSPDGHHGIADELFDGAAVPTDDYARRLEVPAEQFAHLLRVTTLGQGGEGDEIGEYDGDDTALGNRRWWWWWGCSDGVPGNRRRLHLSAQIRSALAAESSAVGNRRRAVGAYGADALTALRAELLS
jgi:hypothetical protein